MAGPEDKYLDLLIVRRQYLDEERIKTSNSFDKYLLTFSTGSLYLSILFTRAIGDGLCCKRILGSGWVLLILSIVATLSSIYFSENAFSKQINITDKELEAVYKDEEMGRPTNYWNRLVMIARNIGSMAFIFGVITLSYFYFVNI